MLNSFQHLIDNQQIPKRVRNDWPDTAHLAWH